jgi:hypothetical protein
MGRYNKIFAGPVDMTKPQVRELPAGAAITPGQIITQSGATFVAAGATTTGKVYIAQENYPAMEGVGTNYATGDTVLGLELIPGMIYSALIANTVNVARDAALTTGASGTLAIAGDDDPVVAFAEEAFNNTTGAAALVRVRAATGGVRVVGS